MSSRLIETTADTPIRVLVADDDVQILRCYRRAFEFPPAPAGETNLESLSDELFGTTHTMVRRPAFEVVECLQGDKALNAAQAAIAEQAPFEVIVLDVRMPPGPNGVDVGERIRRADPMVPIVFVSGYSDVSKRDLARRVPPASRLHLYTKPLSFKTLARDIARIARGKPAGGAA